MTLPPADGLMNRFLVLLCLAYTAGIGLGRLWLEAGSGPAWLASVLLLLFFLFSIGRQGGFFKAFLLLLAAAAGGAAFHYAVLPDPAGIVRYAGTPVYLEGVVEDEPHFFLDHDVYRLRVEAVETREGRFSVPGTLLVKIYGPDRESYWFGERLRLRGTVVEPRGRRNPGGFDYRYHLQSRGIDALVYPGALQVESLGPGAVNKLNALALGLRTEMSAAVMKTLPSPAADLLVAIIFGQRLRLPSEIEENFRMAGAGHLMAVSGLHVGLVAALALGLWRFLKLRGPLPLVLAIVLVFAYAFMTGLRPSALRAALMICAALAALLLDRERDLPTALALAALVTLFFNPLHLFTPGFQFSYAATLALVYAYHPLQKLLAAAGCPRLLRPPLAVTIAAQVGVLPLSVYYFHHLPAGALFFNLLLLPLLPFLVGLGLGGAMVSLFLPPAGSLLLWASRPLLELMIIITAISRRPGFYIALDPPGLLFLVFFYGLLALALFLYYRWETELEQGRSIAFIPYLVSLVRGRFAAGPLRAPAAFAVVLFAAVILVWSGFFFPGRKDLVLTFIDVGQGHAALIETPCGAAIMVDAGGTPAYRGDPGAVGEQVVLPFLRYRGIRTIDLAVVTHPHEDHFGGFIPLVNRIEIGAMLVSPVGGGSEDYENLLEAARTAGIAIHEAAPGQIWSCGPDLSLEILGPPEKLYRGTTSDLNENSIVFLLHFGDIRMLFTGDIEDRAAADLIRGGACIAADLLLVPHHGGYMEAMPAFLEAVGPEIAVIQVGVNPFGHPHPFVLQALQEAAVSVYRNDHHGAVIVETDGRSMQVRTTEERRAIGQ